MGTFLVSQQKGTRLRIVLACALSLFASAALAEPPAKLKVALTFDDLPLNGTLATGAKQSDYVRATLAVFKTRRVPPSYGFINANKLERNPDGAIALKLWIAAGHPLGNHTYTHIDLTKNNAEDFQREILRNEPALELLTSEKTGPAAWRWFRYPYLHEGDTLEKRRAVRAFLASNGYRIAHTTLDWEDYLWNSAHARCAMKKDTTSIQWLRESYLSAATAFMRFQRENSRTVFGRDINHVLLLHLGSFSSVIVPHLLELLKAEGYEVVTLDEAQSDPIYETDPDLAEAHGGTLVELMMQKKGIGWPANAPTLPRERLTTICQ
jgi:peptidoglycan/xylan/chitin deacetylase (PgdA/CDA1 family)